MKYNSVEERFWAKVKKDSPDKCWLWKAGRDGHGYGLFYLGRRYGRRTNIGAHRFAYQTTIGVIPDELEIDHLCRQPLCVNPNHLEAVPHQINIWRGPWAKRKAATKCLNGHPFDLLNTYIWHEGRYCRECRRIREAQRRRRLKAIR